MKLLNNVIEIFNKYELNPIILPSEYSNVYEYLKVNSKYRNLYISTKNDIYFLKKYKNYISLGHYGFSIGDPIIPAWNEIIDEVLELCISHDPDFSIQQIKLKYGYICFYVESNIISDILDIELYITQKLYDKNLVY